MANVTNIKAVIKALKGVGKKYGDESKPSVVVGYNAKYAIYVHENIEMKWKGKKRRSGLGVYWGPTGQAKFLEQPFRELGTKLGRMIPIALKNGATLLEALYMAGLGLQASSQKLVPYEYGDLFKSAFTEKETGE